MLPASFLPRVEEKMRLGMRLTCANLMLQATVQEAGLKKKGRERNEKKKR